MSPAPSVAAPADRRRRALGAQGAASPIGILLAAVVLALLAGAALAAPKFPALSGRVVDEGRLLSPAAEQRLTERLAALERQTGRQVVVATLPSLQGYEIEDYGYQLLRAWGVGRKAEDDGAILIVAPAERKVRIEVGYGLEPVLTDALSKVIIESRILPAFRAGDMEAGIVAGADAIVEQLALPEEDARARAAQAPRPAVRVEGAEGGVPAFVVALFVLWILFSIMRGGRRRRGGAGLWWLLPILLSSGRGGGGGWRGGGGFGGGFSGGGGSGGGGGASGSW